MFTPARLRSNSYLHDGLIGNLGNQRFLYCESPTIRRFGEIYSVICAVSRRNFAKVLNLVMSISMLIWASEEFLGTHKI